MARISNALEMYMLLQSQSPRPMTLNDLARTLEISTTTVRWLRDELDKAGFYIDSIRGCQGGYYVHPDQKRLRWERV